MEPVKKPPQPRLAQTSDYAVQYRPIDSPIHRLGAGWKMLLGMALCAAALGAREPWSLALMFAINAGYYFLARLSLADLLRDLWFFLIQMAVVIILYGCAMASRRESGRGCAPVCRFYYFSFPA